MKLSIHIQAFVNLMKKVLVAIVLCGAVGILASTVPFNLLLGGASVALMFFAIYNLYCIELSELERKRDRDITAK
jgi:hypothetical protein